MAVRSAATSGWTCLGQQELEKPSERFAGGGVTTEWNNLALLCVRRFVPVCVRV